MLPCLATLSLAGYGLSKLFHLPGLKLLLLGRSFESKTGTSWALFQGFAVVQGKGWKDRTPRSQFVRLMLRLKSS
jgi:hypothetical protein